MNANQTSSPPCRRRLLLALAPGLALLIALGAAFTPTAAAVQITEFPLPAGSEPVYIAAGADGNLWFTDAGANKIGRITTAGAVTEYGLGITPDAKLSGIAAGPEGDIWFTERGGGGIGRITPQGVVTEFSAGLTGSPDIYGIAAGPGGKMWFTETSAGRIGAIDPSSGAIQEFPVPAGTYTGLSMGPDGNIWFVNTDKARIARMTPGGSLSLFGPLPASDCAAGASKPCPYPLNLAIGQDGNFWMGEARGNAIARITTSGGVSEYTDGLTHGAGVADITAGPEGNMWFTESSADQVGRITPSGLVTEFGDGISQGAEPIGIAAGSDGNLWVTERAGGEIARVIPDVPPEVVTGVPLTASRIAATVSGAVRSRGAATNYYFQYGVTASYGGMTPIVGNGSGDNWTSVSATIGGLAPGTTYHYRIVATSANGTTYGQDMAFATAPAKPHRRRRRRPRMTVKPFQMYFSGYVAGRRLRLSKLVVIHVHRGERVSFRCKRCHGSPGHGKKRAKRARVVFRRLKLVVNSGSRLRLKVTAKNGSRRVKIYGFHVGRAEARLEGQRCFAPGRRKAVSCSPKRGHQGSKKGKGKKGKGKKGKGHSHGSKGKSGKGHSGRKGKRRAIPAAASSVLPTPTSAASAGLERVSHPRQKG